MTRTPARSTVTIATHPLWQIRLAHELPRYLLYTLCVAGLAASARFAIAPPRPAPAAAPSAPSRQDLAAEGYASLFARRYLTWNAAEPEASMRALASLVGPGVEPDAGLRLPATGEQHVEWVEVVQEREPVPREHVYTVAAQTDAAGLLYLTVGVARRADGSLALAGYPAFVGAPATGPAQAPARVREVGDPALATVVERALRNYLAASPDELAADLTRDARVSLPDLTLTLQSVAHLSWSPDGHSVVAVVQADDARGVQYTLAYEVDVTVAEGRWEVSAVQMDPDM
jgi:Conjugative transposon protein TcpC